jgi:uncharacterized protein (DUF2235 family)
MARNIVLCLDGTSNQYAAVNTNVVKLYAMLDRARNDQLSYYQPGIGTIAPPGVWGRVKRWFVTRLDLAIAFSSSGSAAAPIPRARSRRCSTRSACSPRATRN